MVELERPSLLVGHAADAFRARLEIDAGLGVDRRCRGRSAGRRAGRPAGHDRLDDGQLRIVAGGRRQLQIHVRQEEPRRGGSRRSRPIGWSDSGASQRNWRSSGSFDSLRLSVAMPSDGSSIGVEDVEEVLPASVHLHPHQRRLRARRASGSRSRERGAAHASGRTSSRCFAKGVRQGLRRGPVERRQRRGPSRARGSGRTGPAAGRLRPSARTSTRDPFFALNSTCGASIGSVETYSIEPRAFEEEAHDSRSPAKTGAARPDFEVPRACGPPRASRRRRRPPRRRSDGRSARRRRRSDGASRSQDRRGQTGNRELSGVVSPSASPCPSSTSRRTACSPSWSCTGAGPPPSSSSRTSRRRTSGTTSGT